MKLDELKALTEKASVEWTSMAFSDDWQHVQHEYREWAKKYGRHFMSALPKLIAVAEAAGNLLNNPISGPLQHKLITALRALEEGG